MRVALFLDGNNYYRGLRDFDQGLEIDFERFAAWITRAIGGEGARFVGAYYYTGTMESGGTSDPLGAFLDKLETLTGYFVRREPRVRRVSVCRSCQAANEYFTEKRVDTRLVAEMIELAAVNCFDVACLISGDGDFVPAVQAVGALGKQVYAAVWPGQPISRELRAHSFGVIDLGQGAGEFNTGRRRPGADRPEPAEAAPPRFAAGLGDRPPESEGDVDAALLSELRLAEEQLPYVSRWYFLNRWRGHSLPSDPAQREAALERLVHAGRVEGYTTEDASGRTTNAIRTTEAGRAAAASG